MSTTAPTKTKTQPASSAPSSPTKPSAAPTQSPSHGAHVLTRWLTTSSSSIGRHPLHVMTELPGVRAAVLDEIRDIMRSHYVSPEVTTERIAALGAPKTAQLLREHVPKTKTARSGDLGEVLATEVAEQALKFDVPIRRLRWKDGREMALRGDDIVGIRIATNGKLEFLKGESKSRVALSSAVLDEAGAALDRDRGRPTRHAVLFVAERLRELGNGTLAAKLENAVLGSFSESRVEHLIFALTGGDPKKLLTDHLTAASGKKRTRHAVGVRIVDHGAFIDLLFGGL